MTKRNVYSSSRITEDVECVNWNSIDRVVFEEGIEILITVQF